MEIHQLKYFVAVAHIRHFQKAAESVHISQPTLSQQIQKLEKELGTSLIERAPRQIKLTPAGERFLPYALSILETITKAETDIKEQDGELSGSISMGTIPTIGPYLLPPVIKSMRSAAPKVRLELHDLTTPVLLQSLKEGRIQMGLLALPIDDRNIASRSLGKEPFMLAVSSKHALAKKKSASVRDLEQERILVLQEGHCFRDQSLSYCKLSANSPQIVFQGSNLISVMRLAAIEEGVTFVPKMAAIPQENPHIKFVALESPKPFRELGLIWRMSTPLTRAQNFFIETIEKEFQKKASLWKKDL